MKIFFILCVVLFGSVAQGQEAKLCHIASAGFYATDGEKGILFDALYADGLDGYEQASNELNRRLENAEGMFEDVRLVFASHFHGDHMTGKAIHRHLKANKKAIAVVTEQARTVVAAAGNLQRVKGQLKSYRIPIGDNLIPEGMPFPITLYGISHGEGRPIENIGIAVTIAGKIIMHVGDMSATEEDLIRAGVDEANVDYLLLPFWYMMSKESANEINRIFKPKNIIPMHFPPPFGAGNSGPENQKQVMRTANNMTENVIKLDEEMMCIPLN